MGKVMLTGLALGLAGLSAPAAAGGSAATLPLSGQAHVAGGRAMHHVPMRKMYRHSWGHRVGGRWHAGWFAPGGWSAWRRPVAGYALPRYWIQPAFYVPNYWVYGLPAPAAGYGWSRYYDDAVLTDRHGRVQDYRGGVHWDVGDDDRWHDAPPRLPEYDVGAYGDYGVTYDGEEDMPGTQYRGSWTGTWTGEDGRTYSGTYSGTFHGDAHASTRPHWEHHYSAPMLPYQESYYAYGYYPAPVVTTVVVHPAVTTTTTTTFIEEEVVHRAPRKPVKSKIIKRRSVKGR